MFLGEGGTSRVGGPTSPGAGAQGEESPTRAARGGQAGLPSPLTLGSLG